MYIVCVTSTFQMKNTKKSHFIDIHVLHCVIIVLFKWFILNFKETDASSAIVLIYMYHSVRKGVVLRKYYDF